VCDGKIYHIIHTDDALEGAEFGPVIFLGLAWRFLVLGHGRRLGQINHERFLTIFALGAIDALLLQVGKWVIVQGGRVFRLRLRLPFEPPGWLLSCALPLVNMLVGIEDDGLC
jgi:hypothetical protein